MAIFGTSGNGTQDNGFLEGNTFGSSATLIDNGIISKITALIVSMTTGPTVRGLIYADSAGLPGALLYQTAARPLATSDVGNQDFVFTNPQPLSPGTYWLCLTASGGSNFTCRSFSNSSLSQLKAAIAPDPFGTPTTNFEGPSIIYATYTVRSMLTQTYGRRFRSPTTR